MPRHTTPRHSALATLLVSVAVSFTPSLAFGQEDARTHFLRGQTAYQQGDNETAIREWNSAYSMEPRPRLQYNLAQAYERLGKLSEALQSLERFIQTAEPTDPFLADGRVRLSSLRERLARTGIAVRGGPEGASIFVDDREWGRTPRPDAIAVQPGSHRVVVRLNGYEDFNSSVVVPAGQLVEVQIEMRQAVQAPPPPPQGVQPAAARRDDEGADRQGGSSIVPYIVLGAGGAAIATGAILGVLALSKAGDASARDSSDADSAKGLALGADIALGVGIATASVGLILLLTQDDSDAEERPVQSARLHVVPTVSRNGGGAAALLQF